MVLKWSCTFPAPVRRHFHLSKGASIKFNPYQKDAIYYKEEQSTLPDTELKPYFVAGTL